MNQVLQKTTLAVAGLLLLIVGLAIVFIPIEFAATNGVILPNAASALSEYRAPGAMLLVSAVYILRASVHTRSTTSALALATLVYGSYGASRMLSIRLDGLPSASLTQAMIVELLVGSMCLVMLIRSKFDDKTLSLNKNHPKFSL